MNCRFCNKEMKLLTSAQDGNKSVSNYICECGATIKQARLKK